MSKLLSRPKVLLAVMALGILGIVGLIGGTLGEAFGGGFLSGPLAHIQLPAEALTEHPLVSLGPLGDFAITNTMAATWLTIFALLVFSLFATRKVSLVPSGLQNLAEMVLEAFLNLAENVAGKSARRFFPLVMTIFLFVMAANWLGILPGFGTIGFVDHHEISHFRETHILGIRILYLGFGTHEGAVVGFLRSANTDLNSSLALALIAMVMVEYWGIRSNGFFSYAGRFLNVNRLAKGQIAGVLDLFVGLLEAISEIARVISFTFRLFGNIFAGEVLLAAMALLVPLVGLVPFLGLELFVGLIQAFIFAMLTLVFATMASVSHKGEEH